MPGPRNPNAPKKGSIIKVDPITRSEDIQAIKDHLKDDPRNLAIFTVGINTNLRASDILGITVGQVRNLKPMDEIVLREKKTGKVRKINLNAACVRTINAYMETFTAEDDELLFELTVSSLSRLVKKWGDMCGIKAKLASHSLRKTWCYHQYFNHSTSVAVLMAALNHGSERQTLTYIGVSPEHLEAAYAHEI